MIYIAGLGRSGSTVLAATLGQVSGVLSVGELDRLTRTKTRGPQICACGELGENCSFWGEILQRWRDRITDEGVAKYGLYQTKLERLRSYPRLNSMQQNPTPEFLDYSSKTSELLDIIAELSGSRAIVDSSKGPMRALALIEADGIDLHFIHLIRDGRGVLWSRKGRPSRQGVNDPINRRSGFLTFRVISEWIFINKLCERVASKSRAGHTRIIYERFARDPAFTVGKIMEAASWHNQKTDPEPTEIDQVSFGHTMGGNPVRFSGQVEIIVDVEWRIHMSRRESDFFWLLAGRLAKRYGYQKT